MADVQYALSWRACRIRTGAAHRRPAIPSLNKHTHAIAHGTTVACCKLFPEKTFTLFNPWDAPSTRFGGRHGCSPVISDMRACARSQACVRRVCECVRGVCCATTFATDIPSAARASPSPVFPDLVPVRRLSVAAWGRALHRTGLFTVRSCLGRHWQSRRQVLAPVGTLTASLSVTRGAAPAAWPRRPRRRRGIPSPSRAPAARA